MPVDWSLVGMLKFAFIGNPNTGKSSLINALSKNNQLHVGNWGGVTFVKKVIKTTIENQQVELIDLPGIYSFDDINQEAKITQDEIIKGDYDMYINVIDATNITRNLFLTVVLLELNLPVITIVNYADLLKKYKYNIDVVKLEKLLRSPCLLVSATKKTNVDKILPMAVERYNQLKDNPQVQKPFYFYDANLQQIKTQLETDILKSDIFQKNLVKQEDKAKFWANFYSIRLLEDSGFIKDHHSGFLHHNKDKQSKTETKSINEKLANDYKEFIANLNFDTATSYIINKRSKYAANIAKAAISKKISEKRVRRSLAADKVILNKWAGIPIFLVVMLMAFLIIFSFATPWQNLIQNFFVDFLGGWIYQWLGHPWYASLLVAGIIGGVGVTLSFVPLMFLLFVLINVLRETGYMARVSHLLDALLSKINLNGKAIIPLILGFGCNVGSIYATRSIANFRQRKLTAMVSPFMSCSSRLTIYGLFVAAFFGSFGGLIIFLMYIIGIVVALLLCLITRIFSGKFSSDEERLFELPPYRLPSFSIVMRSSARNIKGYIKTASTIIVIFSIFIWLISYFPNPNDPSSSILAVFAKGLGYVFYPLGFGSIWQLVASIIPAIVAKEITISTLGVLAFNNNIFGNGIPILQQLSDMGWLILQSFINLAPNFWFNFLDSSSSTDMVKFLQGIISTNNSGIGTMRAFSYMMFMLLTIPCVTTLAALKQEFGYKVMWQSVALGLSVPYILCAIVFWISFLIL